jgi:osmoprotectant transport system permease protein
MSSEQNWRQNVPIAALIWVFFALLIFLVGQQTVTLTDEERFVNDIALESEAVDAENNVAANVVGGTFRFNEESAVFVDLPTAEYTPESAEPIAEAVFGNVDGLTSMTVAPDQITVSYEGEIANVVTRVQRLVVNEVTLTRDEVDVSEDGNTIIFTPQTGTFQTAEFTPELIPEGETEEYADREAGLNGSPLAQAIFSEVNSLEGLTIEPGKLTITYRDGAVENQVVERVEEAMNDFYPRASLAANLWVFTVEGSAEKIITIVPIDSGFQLFWFTLFFALIELAMFFTLRTSDDKLIRPIIRSVGVFLLFWSIFGHEPYWDYILSQVFPTSRQLVHPNGTVIQFAAQHLELVIVSSLITIPGGLLIGIIVTRDSFRELLPLINNLVNSGQTIPTIAIVAIMAPIIGFGFWPAIIALIAYGLLPVVRNTIAGLEGVDAFVIDSAKGMGMTPTQILAQIELPIASNIIMAGVRTSMVINVGTATLGAFVGSGGLGTPIASGLAMSIDPFVLLGAIPAALLAILVDYILGRVEFVLTPKGLQVES